MLGVERQSHIYQPYVPCLRLKKMVDIRSFYRNSLPEKPSMAISALFCSHFFLQLKLKPRRRYAVCLNQRSWSRALQSWKSGNFQQLSPLPFKMGAGNWSLIPKLGHNIQIWSGRIIDIWPSFCVAWLWSWQKHQLRRVDRQSCTGLIYWLLFLMLCGTFCVSIVNEVVIPFVCHALVVCQNGWT